MPALLKIALTAGPSPAVGEGLVGEGPAVRAYTVQIFMGIGTAEAWGLMTELY